jgi:hypothetical protein
MHHHSFAYIPESGNAGPCVRRSTRAGERFFIKIIYEYGGDTGHRGRPSIDKATLQTLVAATHIRGKMAVVQIHGEQQAMDAIESNADSRAHLFAFGGDVVDPKFVPLVAERHAFVIPTFSVLESVCNERVLDSIFSMIRGSVATWRLSTWPN